MKGSQVLKTYLFISIVIMSFHRVSATENTIIVTGSA